MTRKAGKGYERRQYNVKKYDEALYWKALEERKAKEANKTVCTHLPLFGSPEGKHECTACGKLISVYHG